MARLPVSLAFTYALVGVASGARPSASGAVPVAITVGERGHLVQEARPAEALTQLAKAGEALAGSFAWIMGGPGQNCDEACTEKEGRCAGDNFTSEAYYGWPQTATQMVSKALRAGLTCSGTTQRCDMGEVPLFVVEDCEDVAAETVCGNCYYCRTIAGDNAWRSSYLPKCSAKYATRTRLCPCRGIPGQSSDETAEEVCAMLL